MTNKIEPASPTFLQQILYSVETVVNQTNDEQKNKRLRRIIDQGYLATQTT